MSNGWEKQPRSSLVIVLAILSLLVGSLATVFGSVGACVLGFEAIQQISKSPQDKPNYGWLLASGTAVGGILLLLSAIGLLLQRRWGRNLALALGAVSGMVSALFGWALVRELTSEQGDAAGVALLASVTALLLAYPLLAYPVLLRRSVAQELGR